MKDSERFTQQAMEMSRKAASAPTAEEREGYLSLAGAYAKMASDAAYFEARYGPDAESDRPKG